MTILKRQKERLGFKIIKLRFYKGLIVSQYYKDYKGFDVFKLSTKEIVKIDDQADEYTGTYLIRNVSKDILTLTDKNGLEVNLSVEDFIDTLGAYAPYSRLELNVIE